MNKIIANCELYMYGEDSVRVFHSEGSGEVYFGMYGVANALWYGGIEDFYGFLEGYEHVVIAAQDSTDVDHAALTTLGVAHCVLNRAWTEQNLAPSTENALAFWEFAERTAAKERDKWAK